MCTSVTSPYRRFMTRHDALESQVGNALIDPGNPDYDDARHVYNAMVDKRPEVIARCSTAADVQAVVAHAHSTGLPLAVRGGGHSGPGFGTVDGGIVADLSPMHTVDVDQPAGTVRVGGGATFGMVDAATHPHGLAVPSGIISTTGVGGLTLGGGHGYLTRRYGLTIDNLLAAEVVLADGRQVTASDDEHPDLFWALRGGSGNFGIVTSFTFRGRPVRDVIAGPTAWPISATEDVLGWYRDFLPAADDDLFGFFAVMTVPPVEPFPEAFHLHKVCAIVWCFLGDPDDADEAFTPVREREPAWTHIGQVPFPALQSTFDGLYPPGLQWYWRGDIFDRISDETVAVHARFADALPTMHSSMHLYPIDGATNRVGEDDTAWAHRDATFSQVIVGVDPDPAHAGLVKNWAVDYWEATHPGSVGGAYVNFMMDDEGQDRVRATFGPHYDRLAAVKATYDPTNLFHVNQNIRPA